MRKCFASKLPLKNPVDNLELLNAVWQKNTKEMKNMPQWLPAFIWFAYKVKKINDFNLSQLQCHGKTLKNMIKVGGQNSSYFMLSWGN